MNKLVFLLVCMIALFMSDVASAAEHPNMYMNQAEVNAVKAKISAGKQPWARAYSALISRANRALNLPRMSIRFQGTKGNGGVSAYYSNPDRSKGRVEYGAAIKYNAAVRDLGKAYAFSGQAKYAKKAISMIYTWCLDPATRMKPGFFGGNHIEMSITMPGMMYGADMMWNYPGWKRSERDAFQAWAQAFAKDVKRQNVTFQTNNFGSWRLVLIGSLAIIAEDDALISYVSSHYKKLAEYQIHPTGYLGMEADRHIGIDYSSYATSAMLQVCEMARHHGVDLYNWKTSNGKGSVRKSVEWITPFMLNPSSWKKQQIRPYTGTNSAAWELAYKAFGDPEMLKVINKYGRPMYDGRTAGNTTLTHAREAGSGGTQRQRP